MKKSISIFLSLVFLFASPVGAQWAGVLAGSPPSAAPSLAVVAVTKGRNGGASPVTITVSPTAGNLLVVFLTHYTGTAVLNDTCTDNQGGTWTTIDQIDPAGLQNVHASAFYQKNCAAGITTITCDFLGIDGVAICVEISGAGASAPLAEHNVIENTANNAAANTSALTNANAASIILGFLTNSKGSGTATLTPNQSGTVGTYTAPANGQETDANTYMPASLVYQIVSSSASQTHFWATDNVASQLVFNAAFH